MSKFDMIRSILAKNKFEMTNTSQRIPLVAGCVIREIKKDMRADIYVPALATVLLGVRVVFPSLGNQQGDIMSPAENSEGLYIITTEGHRFVLGGVSPTENYFPHQIMPRENERYNEQAFRKMDRKGGVTDASSGCAVSALKGDGSKFGCHTYHTELSLHTERIESEVHVQGELFLASVTRFYRKIAHKTQATKTPSEIIAQADELIRHINTFLCAVQNQQHSSVKTDYTPYLMRRSLYKIVQEGLVFKDIPKTAYDMSCAKPDNVERYGDEFVVYRESYFDDEVLVRSHAITESGVKI